MIGVPKLWLDLAIAHWPRLSHAFWEAGQLWLLKIEWGPGDRYNQYPGGNRVKGAWVAVQMGPYSDTGGLGGTEVTILWPSWHIFMNLIYRLALMFNISHFIDHFDHFFWTLFEGIPRVVCLVALVDVHFTPPSHLVKLSLPNIFNN